MLKQPRTVLDNELNALRDNILRLSSMVDAAIEQAMIALDTRDINLANQVDLNDQEINLLRYTIEEDSLRLIATQQPAARDLRRVIAAIHMAVELERIGDHAAGIARLVERLEDEDEIDSLHKLPKMAKRARQMLQEVTEAYLDHDSEKAHSIIKRDDKIDKQYRKLFRETLEEMRDDDYIRRATYLLFVGHSLERIGDRATNIAERVVFMTTGEYIEIADLMDSDE
jgi:phosphate transport system protein